MLSYLQRYIKAFLQESWNKKPKIKIVHRINFENQYNTIQYTTVERKEPGSKATGLNSKCKY